MASYDLDKKLALLEQYDFSWQITWFPVPWVFNIWLPILFGLFYTFIYPMASKKFYEFTLEKNKELKVIKQNIEDVTPVTQEEARALREDINQYPKTIYDLQKKLTEAEARYKKKAEEANKIDREMSASIFTKFKKESTNLPKVIKKQEDDKTKFLRYLYEANYKATYESHLLDGVVDNSKMARPKAKKIFEEMIKKKILDKDQEFGEIHITSDGNELLLEMFDKEN